MNPEHTMRVEGRVVTCTCGYSVAFPENVEPPVAAAVVRKHLESMRAPLINSVRGRGKKSGD
jgi:hypothetical protein